MYIDLNVPFPTPFGFESVQKKQKQKKGQQQQQPQAESSTQAVSPSHPLDRLRPADRVALRKLVETLILLGYTVIAFTQTLQSKLEVSTHQNWFDGGDGTIFPDLDPRYNGGKKGCIQLRRLNVVLDEGSEKGFGFNAQSHTLLASYDILSLTPFTQATFQLACLSHTVPSPTTVHLITVPLSTSRTPFFLKHSLVKTALRNGGRFEVCYAGAVGADTGGRRNWWAGAREVVRAVGGEGVVMSSGAEKLAELRAPLDMINLGVVLGLAQNHARDTLTTTPKSLLVRAETRKTYRAILSEPTLVFPSAEPQVMPSESIDQETGPAAGKRKSDQVGDDEDIEDRDEDGEKAGGRRKKKRRR